MHRINHTVSASTLVETLVTMLVASVVFLTVMDGMTLFMRLQTRCTQMLMANGRQRDGYFRIASIVEGADRIVPGRNKVGIYRGELQSEVLICDSALVYRTGEFRDTLLRGVTALGLSEDDPDSLKITLSSGFTIRLVLKKPSETRYLGSLDEIEDGYGYEE